VEHDVRRQHRQVTVIGGGVSGLTTAVLLQENGYTVRIVAGERSDQTTSAVAAAIWHPFFQQPDAFFHQCARVSYARFRALSKDCDTGVVMRPLVEVFRKPTKPLWWADIPDSYSKLQPGELPSGYCSGYRAAVPVIDTKRYLPYLERRLQQAGGTIALGKVRALHDAPPSSIIVNCTGLGARELASDDSVYPVLGHVLLVPRHTNLTKCVIDDSDASLPTYVIPRISDCVIGGTARRAAVASALTELEKDEMLDRATKLSPSIRGLPVLERKLGSRPMRASIRVECDSKLSRVIHNYGHGGSGFTVSWGCSQRVLDIAKSFVSAA
jgi:D-amino-acid oxidase